MEPWLIITLAVVGVIVLALLAWFIVAVISLRAFKRASDRMDRDFHNHHFRNF